MGEATEIEKALAWLIDNSDGVLGLRADGAVMPWSDVLSRYMPMLSSEWADKELLRHRGLMPKCEWCGADLVDGECATAGFLGACPEAPDDEDGDD